MNMAICRRNYYHYRDYGLAFRAAMPGDGMVSSGRKKANPCCRGIARLISGKPMAAQARWRAWQGNGRSCRSRREPASDRKDTSCESAKKAAFSRSKDREPDRRGSTMVHPAVIAFLALGLATILDLRAADATAISPLDLSSLQFCVGCERPKNDDLQIYLDRPVSAQTTTVDIDANEDQDTFDCRNPTEGPTSGEAEPLPCDFPTVISIGYNLESVVLDPIIPAKYWEYYLETNYCTYFESHLHDPKHVQDKCGYIEPGSDYSELISMLTISVVSVLSFALIALAWLLHRAYRSRRLRKMIPQGATTPHSYARKGRRRVGGSMSA